MSNLHCEGEGFNFHWLSETGALFKAGVLFKRGALFKAGVLFKRGAPFKAGVLFKRGALFKRGLYCNEVSMVLDHSRGPRGGGGGGVGGHCRGVGVHAPRDAFFSYLPPEVELTCSYAGMRDPKMIMGQYEYCSTFFFWHDVFPTVFS